MIVHKILAADTRRRGVKKIPQIWIQQFKFAPQRMHVTAARLAVALYSPVHSNGVRRPNVDKAVKDLRTVTHTTGSTIRQIRHSPRAGKKLN
jgi:hypothetical protein